MDLVKDAIRLCDEYNRTTQGAKIQFCGTSSNSFELFLDSDENTKETCEILRKLLISFAPSKYNDMTSFKTKPKSGMSNVIYTHNQERLDIVKANMASIDKKYICPILGQVIDIPVVIPDTNLIVDGKGLADWFRSNPNNPFNPKLDDWEQEDFDKAKDDNLESEIFEYVFSIVSTDFIRKINNQIKLDDIHKQAYMSFEGNPYGEDNQLYKAPFSFKIFSIGAITAISKQGELISKYQEKHTFKQLNYPHSSKTEKALRDLIFAMETKNSDAFEKIRACYPMEAAKFLFEFADLYKGEFKIDHTYVKENLPRPLELKNAFTCDPHRKTVDEFEPIFYRGQTFTR
jgi:hypothetical protein